MNVDLKSPTMLPAAGVTTAALLDLGGCLLAIANLTPAHTVDADADYGSTDFQCDIFDRARGAAMGGLFPPLSGISHRPTQMTASTLPSVPSALVQRGGTFDEQLNELA